MTKRQSKRNKMKENKKHPYKKTRKNFLTYLLIFSIVLLIPIVSAEKLTYSEDELNVTLHKTIFFGLLKVGTIGELQLKSHSSIDYVKPVGIGNQVVMWYDFDFKNIYENGLGKITFIDMNTKKEIQRNYSYVYWNEDKWIPYNSKDIPKGKIRIGIKVEVRIGDYVDGIWEIGEQKVTEHASWTSSLDTNLLSYYKMDDDGSPMIDEQNANDGTNNGATTGVTGIIETAYDFEASENDYAVLDDGTGTIADITDGNLTINMWVKRESSPAEQILITGNTSGFKFSIASGGEIIFTKFGEAGITSTDTIGNGAWHMVTAVYDTSANKCGFFINGTQDSGGLQACDKTFAVSPYRMAQVLGGANEWDGVIDEVGIWTRSLTNAEVTQLWNGGAGISPSNINITLNSPTNSTNSTTKTITFDASIISDSVLQNISLIINNIYDQTNSSPLNNSETIFTKSFTTPSTWRWKYEVCDISNQCINSSEYHINYDSIFKESEIYTSSLIEGAINRFTATFLTNGTDITIANLSYNGTGYLGSITENSATNFTITRTLSALSVNTDTNIPFNWNITQKDFNYVDNVRNQTILNLQIANCTLRGSINETLYNITIIDEETQSDLGGVTDNTTAKLNLQVYDNSRTTEIANLSTNYTSKNPFGVCFNYNLSSGEKFVYDAQIEFTAFNYDTKFYNIQNRSLNNSIFPTNLTLRALINSSSQTFKIIFKDSSFLPVEDALIQISRRYVEEGLYKIVEIPITDAKGEAIAKLVVNDVIYSISVIKFGEVLGRFNDVKAVCQTPAITECQINLNAFAESVEIPDYKVGADFNYTLSYDNSTRIVTSIYEIPSGSVETITLNVTRTDALGTSICTDTLTSSSGTLTCVVPASFGNETIGVKLYKGGIEAGRGGISLNKTPYDLYGVALIGLALFLMMTLIGSGLSNDPIFTTIFLILGVILLFALNLVANNGFIGKTATILWIIIALVLLIIKGARRN